MNRWLVPLIVVVAAVAVLAVSRPGIFRLAENPPAPGAQNPSVTNPPTGTKADITAQWKTSKHSKVIQEEPPIYTRDVCVQCHTGPGFAKQTTKASEAGNAPLGCNDCHVFGSKNEFQLRFVGTASLANGKKIDAGAARTCIMCHNSRRNTTDPKTLTGLTAPHPSPQADMLYGTNAYEVAGTRYGNSPHAAIENSCIVCHMAAAPGNPNDLGGHSWKAKSPGGTENLNACRPCHPAIKSFDRPAYGDYDGNGTYAGIQTEVKGLLKLVEDEILKATGAAKLGDAGGKIAITDAAGKTMTVTDPKVLQAAYDYLFVEADKSEGVHNPTYAVQLLQGAYRQLTGKDVPGATLK
ncbi:MAG: ammonia-forming cytochrome c nitrite reductase subunit c552 [Chitinophagales bacterium]